MEMNKLKFVNGEIFINAVKVNQVESIEIKSTSEQCSEVILKFDAVVKDLNFEPRKIEVDVSIGEKEIAKQILFEQQKTNELLQAIVSSKEPKEIKLDLDKVGNITYSFIQGNPKEKAVHSSNCDRTNIDSIDLEMKIDSILNLPSGKETLYALGIKNKLKKEDEITEKEIHKIAEILSVITSDYEYYV